MKPHRPFFVAVVLLLTFGLVASATRTTVSTAAAPADASVYNVKTFGAKGDGKTIDTPSINKAIDAVAAGGGGTVYFPAAAARFISRPAITCRYRFT